MRLLKKLFVCNFSFTTFLMNHVTYLNNIHKLINRHRICWRRFDSLLEGNRARKITEMLLDTSRSTFPTWRWFFKMTLTASSSTEILFPFFFSFLQSVLIIFFFFKPHDLIVSKTILNIDNAVFWVGLTSIINSMLD